MARTTRALQPNLRLDPAVQPAAQRLANAISQALVEQQLLEGDPMPSTRSLAAQYRLSRSVVVEAYGTLCGLGILVAEQGSGTRVAPGAAELFAAPDTSSSVRKFTSRCRKGLDLTVPGEGDAQVVDLREWNRAWRDATRPGAAGPGVAQLAEAVTGHLRNFRGVALAGNRLVLRPSIGATMADIVNGLELDQRSVAIEDPGAPRINRQLTRGGCRLHCVPVDGEGLRVATLRPDDRAVLVTPARQWPMGIPLSPARREQLFDWAQSTGGTIIENDQDAEFTYGRAPLPTLYATAPEGVRVIYIGSSRKMVDPQMQMVWAVVSQRFRTLPDDVAPVCGFTARALAHYMDSGAMYRQHNRALHIYEERREALVRQLSQIVPSVTVLGEACGTELVLGLPEGANELKVQAELEKAGFHVSTLGDFVPRRHRPALLLQHSLLPPLQAPRLAGALRQAVS